MHLYKVLYNFRNMLEKGFKIIYDHYKTIMNDSSTFREKLFKKMTVKENVQR